MKSRVYSYRPPVIIDEAEAYARTVAAIRTMDRLPGPMRARVRSNWPAEFELHAEAIKWAVFAGEGTNAKAYKRLKSSDFDDINFGFDEPDRPNMRQRHVRRAAPADVSRATAGTGLQGAPGPMRVSDYVADRVRESKSRRAALNAKSRLVIDHVPITHVPARDDEDDRRRPLAPLTRAAIADAEIAGAWFAALALLPENIAEFEHAVAAFRKGKRHHAWVDDQRIVAMHARGASLKTIGTNLHGGKLNVEQTESRCRAIAGSLATIANRSLGSDALRYGKARR